MKTLKQKSPSRELSSLPGHFSLVLCQLVYINSVFPESLGGQNSHQPSPHLPTDAFLLCKIPYSPNVRLDDWSDPHTVSFRWVIWNLTVKKERGTQAAFAASSFKFLFLISHQAPYPFTKNPMWKQMNRGCGDSPVHKARDTLAEDQN